MVMSQILRYVVPNLRSILCDYHYIIQKQDHQPHDFRNQSDGFSSSWQMPFVGASGSRVFLPGVSSYSRINQKANPVGNFPKSTLNKKT